MDALERKDHRARVRDRNVATRDALIWQLKNDPVLQQQWGRNRNKEIAARLTSAQFTPPDNWGVKTFDEAYRNERLRKRLHKMITVAKSN